ncbi:MAG: NHLP leader peptide family RiPP precursor [Nostoc sp.]
MAANKGRREIESDLIARAWKDEAFKQELIRNPKAVFARESGQKIPENIEIKVVEETGNTLYLVLPKSPQVSEELSDEALEAVAGGGGDTFVTEGTIYDCK